MSAAATGSDGVVERFGHWVEVRAGLMSLLDRMEARDLEVVPVPGGWSLGRILVHVADTEEFWLGHVVAGRPERALDRAVGDHPDRAAVKALLEATHAEVLASLARLTTADLARSFEVDAEEAHPLEWIMWHVIEHEIHHRGEVSLAFGILGREGLDV